MALASCATGPAPGDAGAPVGGLVFARALDGAPGGGFNAVWVLSRAERSGPLDAAWIAGGDPRATGDGRGRLVSFDGASSFRTRCGAPAPLRAVRAVDGRVIAAGDDGVALAWSPSTGACAAIPFAVDATPRPAFYAVLAVEGSTPRAVYFAGERGGRAALFAERSGRLEEVSLPADAGVLRAGTSDAQAGTWLAGDGGTILQLNAATGAFERSALSGAASGASFVTISAGERWVMAADHGSSATVLARRFDATQWSVRTPPAGGPINAMHVELPWEVYLVGDAGFTAAYTGRTYLEPRDAVTTAPLRAVHGRDGVVLAVGGDATGTVLVRGVPTVARYTLDALSYERVGEPLTDLGGSPESQN